MKNVGYSSISRHVASFQFYQQPMSRYSDYPDLSRPLNPSYNVSLNQTYQTPMPSSVLRKTIDMNAAQIDILNKIKNSSEVQVLNSKYRGSSEVSSYLYESRKKTRSTYQTNIQGQPNKQHIVQNFAISNKIGHTQSLRTAGEDKYNIKDPKNEYYLKILGSLPRQKSKSREIKPQEIEDFKEKKETTVVDRQPYKLYIPISQQKTKYKNPSPRVINQPMSARVFAKSSSKFTTSKRQKTPIKHRVHRGSYDQPNIKKTHNFSARLSDFSMRKRLGQGKFGEVFQAIHIQTNALFALKRVKKETIKSYMLQDQFMMEIKMQLFFNHNNILKLYSVFDDIQYIYLVLQYMEEGTLYDKLKKLGPLPEDTASHISRDVLKGVAYLHENSVAHRDIKPENIVITCGVCKLCDFGWSAICQDDDRRTTFCGTLDYSAPQILQGKQYGKAIDLWCLGVLTYELLVGKAPFYHISRKQTMRKIMNAENQQLVLPNSLSVVAREFIKSLIQWDPLQRMQAIEALGHAFIKEYASDDF